MPTNRRASTFPHARRRVSEAVGFAVALTTLQGVPRGAYAVPFGAYTCPITTTYTVLPGGVENTTAGCTIEATGALENSYTFANDAAMLNEGAISNFETFTNNAELDNAGTLFNALIGNFTNSATGTLNNLPSGSFYNIGASYNAGLVTSDGLITNHDTGTIENQSGAQFTNNGTLYGTYGAGISNLIGATITNNGRMLLAPAAVYGAGPQAGLLDPAPTLSNAGELDNAGELISYRGAITNEAGGTLTNGTGGSYAGLYNSGGLLANHGTLVNEDYAVLTNADGGQLTNHAGGLLDNRGALFNYYGAMLVNEAGATLTNAYDGYLANIGGESGAYYGGGGPSTVSNAGQLTNAGSLLNTNFGGDFGLGGYGAARALLYNSGTFDNTGGIMNYAYHDVPGAGAPDGDAAIVNTGTFNNDGYITSGGAPYFYGGSYATGIGPGYAPVSALIRNENTFNNTGSLLNAPGSRIENTATGTLNNTGYLYSYGEFTNAGLVTNATTGLLANYGTATITGTVQSAGEISNEGSFEVSGGASVEGLPDGYGTTVYGSFTQYSGTTLVNGSLVQGTVDFVGGTLAGGGLVGGLGGGVNAFAGSEVSPGNSAGTLQVSSDFACTLCTLTIEIAGSGSFDLLEIAGEAALTGGHIDFDFLDGYTPVLGDTFDFLLAADITDFSDFTFAFLNVALGPGLFFEVTQLTVPGTGFVPGPNADALRLAVAAVPLPGGVWLLGAGLAGLAALGRKNRRLPEA